MERLWYYARGQEQNGPINEAELKALLASGQITGSDLVWTDGMASWAKAESVPDLTASANVPPSSSFEPPAPASTPRAAAASNQTPQGLLGWLSFVGVMNVIYGALSCLSCVGIITGVFLILSGTALMAARKALEDIREIDPAMQPFLAKIKTFAQMTGVVYILALVSMVIMLILYAGFFAVLFSQLPKMTTP